MKHDSRWGSVITFTYFRGFNANNYRRLLAPDSHMVKTLAPKWQKCYSGNECLIYCNPPHSQALPTDQAASAYIDTSNNESIIAHPLTLPDRVLIDYGKVVVFLSHEAY